MLISEVIEKLQKVKDEHGDLPVKHFVPSAMPKCKDMSVCEATVIDDNGFIQSSPTFVRVTAVSLA